MPWSVGLKIQYTNNERDSISLCFSLKWNTIIHDSSCWDGFLSNKSSDLSLCTEWPLTLPSTCLQHLGCKIFRYKTPKSFILAPQRMCLDPCAIFQFMQETQCNKRYFVFIIQSFARVNVLTTLEILARKSLVKVSQCWCYSGAQPKENPFGEFDPTHMQEKCDLLNMFALRCGDMPKYVSQWWDSWQCLLNFYFLFL